MNINKMLKTALILLSILYIGLEISKYGYYADIVAALLLVLLSTTYWREKEIKDTKKPYFLFFLIAFTLAKIIDSIANNIPLYEDDIDYAYFISNTLCILAYIFLIARCIVTFNLNEIIKRFFVTIIILFILGVFCVTLITETAQPQLNNAEYLIEFSYNVVVMTLLSIALINYMDKDNNKSMLFFIGTMFIFFSEMIQLAYYYISDMSYLAAVYSIFLVLAFGFFYKQSKLKHDKIAHTYDFLDENLSIK